MAAGFDSLPRSDSAAGLFSPEVDSWISRLIRGVDTNITLGTWLAEHPNDSVSRIVPDWFYSETFCRSGTTQIPARTANWRRSAVFLIPAPPAGETLPDTGRLAERLCRLWALSLESADADTQKALTVTKALSTRLSRSLGEPRPGAYLTGRGVGRWGAGVSWMRGGRVLVVGADSGVTYYSEEEDADTTPIIRLPTAIAVSFVVGNDLDTGVSALIDRKAYPKVEPEALVAMARADSAIERAGLAGLLPLRRVLAHHRDSARFIDRGERPAPDVGLDSVLLRALAALRDSSNLPPPRQADAFLAADIVLQVRAGALDYRGQDTVFRHELERVGARYHYDRLAAAWFSLRPWLWRAYQLDSLGPAGRSAFAELLAEGWTTQIACRGGPSIPEVIERGERALEAGLNDPMVYVYVAQAHADLFSLFSKKISDTLSDSLRARAGRAETARRRAVEHLRQALANVQDPGLRGTIWDRAVHLMLGLPVDTRYICHWD